MDVQGPTAGLDADPIEALAALLLVQDHCDARTLERGRRVAAESGQRLDKVLIQLGLVSERGLAEALSGLLGVGVARPDQYPVDEAPFGDRLPARSCETRGRCR